MSKEIRQLLYVSTANPEITREDFKDILADSLRNNKDHDISGFLVYHKGQFMQVIEGPAKKIEHLWQNLLIDKRHTLVKKLVDEEREKREFSYWVMGFRDLDEFPCMHECPYVFSTGVLDAVEPSKAVASMQQFVSGPLTTKSQFHFKHILSS